jgi:hypothetical protein
VAVNCWLLPSATEGLDGATEMETRTCVTVNKVELNFPDEEALIVVAPGAVGEANPLLLMVATPGLVDCQTTDPVISTVLVSLNVPVAVNCCGVRIGTVGLTGVTTKLCKVAELTCNVVETGAAPPAALAIIVALPAAMPFASPFVPAVLLIVATWVFEEVQLVIAVVS